MDEQVIDDLYSVAISKGYKKSRQEFVGLLHSDNDVMNDMYSYVQSKGYGKGMDDFKSLVGATSPIVEIPVVEEPVKKKGTGLPSVDGGSEPAKSDGLESLAVKVQDEKILTKQPRVERPIVPSESIKADPDQIDFDSKVQKQKVSAPMSYSNIFAKTIADLPSDLAETWSVASAFIERQLGKAGVPGANPNLTAKDIYFYNVSDDWRKYTDEVFPTNQEDRSTFLGGVVSGLGQVVPMVVSGGISAVSKGKAAMDIAKTALSTGTKLTPFIKMGKDIASQAASPAGLIGGSQMSSAMYREAINSGATEDQAQKYAIENFFVGTVVESLPIQSMFSRMLKKEPTANILRILKEGGIGAGQEAITEMWQTTYSNWSAERIYDFNREMLDGVGEAGAVGGTVGFILNASLNALLGRRARVKTKEEGEILDKSIDEVKSKINTVNTNNENISSVAEELDSIEPIVLNYGDSKYFFARDKSGRMELADEPMLEDQAKSMSNMLGKVYKGLEFSIEEVASNDPYTPVKYNVIANEKINEQQYAIQKQAAGEVPVQPGATVSQEVAQGEPQAEPQVATQESQEEVVDIERKAENKNTEVKNVSFNEEQTTVNDEGIFELAFEGPLLDNYDFLSQGSESRVYLSKDKSHVIKLSEPYTSKDPNVYEKRVTTGLLKDIFGNSGVEVVGYYEYNGTKNPIFRQDYVEGQPLTENEVEDYLRNNNKVVEIDNKFYTKYNDVLYRVSDFENNLIRDNSGKVVPIDLNISEVKDSKINDKYDSEVSALQPQVVAKEGQTQEVVDVFHGGSVKDIQIASINNPLYVSESESQSAAYAKGNQGSVAKFKIDKSKIANEDEVRSVINELGLKPKDESWSVDELNIYELIDPNFDTAMSEESINNLFGELERRGYGGAEFVGMNIETLKNDINDIVIFNPKLVAQEGQVEVSPVSPTQQLDLEGEVALLEQLLAQEETAPTVSAGISILSDTDVQELRNKTQSRSQQATTKQEKDSANARIKIIDTAKRAINTLRSVFPEIDIVLHDDQGSYNAAMLEVSGVEGSKGNLFLDTTPDGKSTGRIDINLSKADGRTVAHEIAHAILLKSFGDNSSLFNDFRTRLSKVLNTDANKQLNDFASRYVDPNTGQLLDVNHEEFLAELTGMLEQQETNVSVTTMQKIAALINEFVSKITGGKFKPFEDTKNTKDVVDFFNTISGAIREGNEIQQLNSQEPYTSGVALPVINPNEFVGKKFRSKLDIGDYKFPSGIDILRIANLPIKTLTELVRQYEGRVVIITSDATGYGVDKNGDPILGGFGFASNEKNVSDGIGFASVSTGTVKGTYTAAEKAYGTGKTLVLVMIQPPNTTINNSYGAKYIIRGLKEIAVSSKEELSKTKESIKTFIKGSTAIQDELKKTDTNQKRGSEKRLFDFIDSIDENTNIEEAVKEFLNDTTFTIRKELGQGILLRNKDIRTDSSTTYSKIAFNSIGYNLYDFLKEYGDNTILTDDLILNDIGGYVVGGFELDVLPNDQREALINEIQNKGIVHPLFNAKLPGTNHFRLDALYDVEENFAQYAVPDTQISLSKEERDALVREIYKDNKFYLAESRSIPLEKRTYTNLTVAAKTEFKNSYLKPRGLLIEIAPKVSTKVARGEGFIPKEGAAEQMSKRNFVSRSQINDALSKASGSTQVATTKGSYRKAANILKNIGVDGDVLDYGAGLGLGTDAMSEVLDKPVDSLEINPERWKGIRPVKYTDANQIDKKYDGIVSLNVVNVVPKEVRDFIVLDIFNNLKEGGTAIISSRGFKGDIDGAKNFVDGGEEKSYIIKKREKGKFIYVFQKGYDGNELFEYIQGLLGDSALVLPNNTFGKRGVVITKLSNVKSRSQLPGNDAQRIVNLGRANGLSDQAISNVLEKRGFTQEAIDTAIGKPEPAAKKVEVTEEFAPGYDRMIGELEGVVEKSLKRGTTQAKAMENAINYLQGTKVYENATDVQREAMVRDVNKRFKKRERRAPSAEKVVGKPKKKEVTVDEMAALKDQIKLEARAARQAKGDLNTKRKALAARIIAARRKGSITSAQARALVNRISKVNLDNPIMVDRLIEYIEKVFDNANYAADMTELRKLQQQAKRKNHTSMTSLVNEFTSINPELIPLDKIMGYKEALDFLNNETPSYDRMNKMLSTIESYKVSEKFDAVKTNDELMDKYKSIIDNKLKTEEKDNKLKTVEDYVALIKDINSFKRKAYQLLQNEAINQKEYDDFIDGAGQDQDKIDRKFSEQISKIKSDLIADINNQRPKPNPEFTKEENDLIKKYLELSDTDLKSLSPEELFILNDLLENIRNGEIDVYRFGSIISKADGNSNAEQLAPQLESSKVDMSYEKGRGKLSEYESSFWEGLLGLGRVTSGALQKFVVSPFIRAISSYEDFLKTGLNQFLKIKNKYKIDRFDVLNNAKEMHKIGMLTTYLQEYMAQFDADNKGVKDIGKRDWFREILNSESIRGDYPEGNPSFTKRVGIKLTEIQIIEKIWNKLPKDSNGNVNPKAVHDSYIANDGKFFTKNEKAFFDEIMKWKKNNSTSKQKAANEMNGNPFKEIPFHMLRSRYGRMSSQITPTTSGDNGMVRIKAGTGKERASEAVGAINTDFQKLFITGLEQTGRDYFLSKALMDINNTLSSTKKKLDGKKDSLMKTISYTLSDALAYEFDRTKNEMILSVLLSARGVSVLLEPTRTVGEFISTFLSFPLRAKTPSGYKNLFGSQVQMRKLLEFTESPLRLRQNINKAIDINDGRIEPQGILMKATNYLSGLPERTMMVTSWMPTFTNEFQVITKEKFDPKKFNDSQAYREKYGKAIREAAAVADAQTEKIVGATTKAGQRRKARLIPEFIANAFGKRGTISRSTAAGQTLAWFSNYPYRESSEFANGFREAAEVLRKDADALKSLSQLSKPLGISINLATYGFLSSVIYATSLFLGDDEDEERGEKLLDELMTLKGFTDELTANAIALAGSRYAAGGKAMLQLGATIGILLTEDEEQQAKIKKILKNSVYLDPLPTQKMTGYNDRDKIISGISKYIPQFVMVGNLYADLIGTKNEVKAIYDKVQSNGIESLTEDEGQRILALNTLINSTQLILNLRGTSLPVYNKLKTYMRGLKEEAGVDKVAEGEAPAKKKSSSGGGSRGGGSKTINKTDLKRYFPEQYNQLYGKDSPGYEIQQEIKAFEKEQREFKKSIKDQVYGAKD